MARCYLKRGRNGSVGKAGSYPSSRNVKGLMVGLTPIQENTLPDLLVARAEGSRVSRKETEQ